MKTIVTRQDMNLLPSFFKFTKPEALPLSFTYGDKTVRGIPSDFNPTVTTKRTDANIIRKTVVSTDKKGLQIKVIYVEYLDYAATEFLAFLTNTSDNDTVKISDLKIIDGVLSLPDATLYHGNGDNLSENGYSWERSDLKEPVCKTPRDGTSCNGAFPYMRLLNDDCGINIGIGWPAMWQAEFEKTDGGVSLKIGQRRFDTVIRPGETMRTPRVNFVAYCGDEARGINMWRRWYFDHILPRENGRPLEGKYCLHHFEAGGHPEFTGADEKNQLEGLREYIRRGLKPTLWWIDAGWYKCDYNWHDSGDWVVDKERFPHGLSVIGEECDKNDIDLLLWFEPERVHDNAKFFSEHPEWIIRHKMADGSFEPDSLVDLGNPDCCNYIINTVDAVIKEGHVKVYRQDFNYDPRPCWEGAETPDRIGAVENLHVQGYLRFWDTLLDRNPGLFIDSCASGGRRNDLETMRRAIPLHYTDIGYGNHLIKQKQHRQMFEWIPYFRAHNMNWENPETKQYDYVNRTPDRFSYYVATVPCMTDMTKYWDSEEQFALAREMQAIWQRASECMLNGDFYPMTECRLSAEDFFVVQFNNPDTGRGMIQLESNTLNKDRVFTAHFKGLDLQSDYILENAETHVTQTVSGKTLADGFDFTLEQRTGIIYFYEKKGK